MKKRKKYISEDDVKKALEIKDFRSLSKEKIMEFVSIIPKVDKEVALSIVNQFPNYADMAKDMVSGMLHICDTALQESKIGKKEVIESYKIVLETLKEELNNGDLSIEERKEITDKMIEVAEKIDNVNDKHLSFLKDMVKNVGGTILGVVIVGASILGAIDNNKNK